MADSVEDIASRPSSAFVPEAALVVVRSFVADPDVTEGMPATPNQYRVESLASVHGLYPSMVAEMAAEDPSAVRRLWPSAGMLRDHPVDTSRPDEESRAVVGVVQFGSAAEAMAAVKDLNFRHGDPWRHPDQPFPEDIYTSYGGQRDLDRDLALLARAGGVVIADAGLSDAMAREHDRVGRQRGAAQAVSLEVAFDPVAFPDGSGAFVGRDYRGASVSVSVPGGIGPDTREGSLVSVRGELSVVGGAFAMVAAEVSPERSAIRDARDFAAGPPEPLRGDSAVPLYLTAADFAGKPEALAPLAAFDSELPGRILAMPRAELMARYAEAATVEERRALSGVAVAADGRAAIEVEHVGTGRFLAGGAAVAAIRSYLAERPDAGVRVDFDLDRAVSIERFRMDERDRALDADPKVLHARFSARLAEEASRIAEGAGAASVPLSVDGMRPSGRGNPGGVDVWQSAGVAGGRDVALYAPSPELNREIEGNRRYDGAVSVEAVPLGRDFTRRDGFLVQSVESRQVALVATRQDLEGALAAIGGSRAEASPVSRAMALAFPALSQPEFARDGDRVVRTGRVLSGADAIHGALATFGSASGRKVYFDVAKLGNLLGEPGSSARIVFDQAKAVSDARLSGRDKPAQAFRPAPLRREGVGI